MYRSKLRVLRLKAISRTNRDVIAARAAYTYVWGRGMRKRGRGGGYVAFTSCDTIMADYNNIDDIRKQKKAEYNRRYKKAKEGGI